MKTFIFESYEFAPETRTASFTYSFNHGMFFTEKVVFGGMDTYDEKALDRALFLSFIITGVSYYKLFPRTEIEWRAGAIDEWQSGFLNKVYQEGLGQYAFENELTRQDLAQFKPARSDEVFEPIAYAGEGIMSLQSGGKDSLLTAETLREKSEGFDSFYISSGDSHPSILDDIGDRLLVARRFVDIPAIMAARERGGLNGHVPVTFIVLSLALIQAVLLNKKTILASIGHEGEEPHAWIGDLAVTHQWSKTWDAELLFSEYVSRYISPDIQVGSPLRRFTELRVAELFIQKAWMTYGHAFSSCNKANYMQGADNTHLKWCGNCPKCANSYLLFAPFLDARELQSIFNGQDLFTKPTLQDTFKGLLGIDDAMKPFECVGEVDELRLAYHMAQARGGYAAFDFEVPESNYDYMQEFSAQHWTLGLIEESNPIQNRP
jgi:UDP-N-acetyl-alpha-D-muramoyl-L-alanyl-L-glutamate epimerase